jgi:DNA uptake protein ComE-like DNA-binding protein
MPKTFAWCLGLVLTLALPPFVGHATAKSSLAKAPAAAVNLNTASQADLVAKQ